MGAALDTIQVVMSYTYTFIFTWDTIPVRVQRDGKKPTKHIKISSQQHWRKNMQMRMLFCKASEKVFITRKNGQLYQKLLISQK